MAVYDRWHKDPAEGDKPCKHGTGRHKLYPSAIHERGDRWQVRWDDPNAPAGSRKQLKKTFALLDPAPGELPDPDKHANAYDAVIRGSIVTRNYVDPNAGNVTLQEYGEQWRKNRVHGESASGGLESRLRNHVYPAAPGSARTPKGGIAIGQHAMGLLAQRPSLLAGWLAAMPLSDGSKGLVLGDVAGIFQAAVEDGIVRSDPTKSSTVKRPPRPGSNAQPYTPAEVAGIAGGLPPRLAILPYLGAGTGMREMEMAALGADDIVRGRKPKVRVLRQLKLIDGQFRVAPVKNRKPHDVPVPAELLEQLDAHMKAFPPVTVTLPWHEPRTKMHGELFTVQLLLSREDGTPASRNALDAAWRTAVARWLAARYAGHGKRRRGLARGYGIHRTRHSFASAQLRAGVDVVRVAAWLGDTVDVVTKTYAHLMPDDHDGEDAGRAASAAFLTACALPVPHEGDNSVSALVRAV